VCIKGSFLTFVLIHCKLFVRLFPVFLVTYLLIIKWLCAFLYVCSVAVAFKIYDIDRDGYISNGELFQVLKMMVGNNLKDGQLQQIVDKTIIYSDKDGDGRISYDEFCAVSILHGGTIYYNISFQIS